jgi:hypothetical protein
LSSYDQCPAEKVNVEANDCRVPGGSDSACKGTSSKVRDNTEIVRDGKRQLGSSSVITITLSFSDAFRPEPQGLLPKQCEKTKNKSIYLGKASDSQRLINFSACDMFFP